MENKEIELRSEEVQEIMGQIPAWIVRWGITLLFIILLILLIGSCFFKYPDVIATQMTLTSTHPAVQVVARTTGRISKLSVVDGQRVRANEVLALIENPAAPADIDRLIALLPAAVCSADSALAAFLPARELSLGDIQSDYVNFLRSLHELENYRTLGYYPKKISSLHEQIDRYRTYQTSLQRQQSIIESQYQIAGSQYARDSLLFIRQVLAPAEHETSRSQWLESKYALENANASIDNLKIQIGQLENEVLDLELERVEKENVLSQAYDTALEQLQNALSGWELNYRLRTPVEGVVTFTKYWNANQHVLVNETVFTIVPHEADTLLGIASLPVQRSGKVKTGQRVIIRFANYPDQEFGVVNGEVGSISLVPNEDNYRVEIALPQGLETNYHRHLPVSREMQATAEIVTEDLRLIERFFMPLKKVLKEAF